MSRCCCPPDDAMIYLAQTRGMCRQCGQLVDARYLSIDGAVYLERICPLHGKSRALVAETLAWFLDAQRAPVAARPPARVTPERHAACPDACGPCAFHGQRCNLPVFSITNACNLRCPICFTYNRDDQLYFMPPEEFSRHIDFVIEATGGVDLVNITGGEPTLHPQLLQLLEQARRPEIGRVTLNTNGLTLAENPQLARQLSELQVYVILSVDTFDAEQSLLIHGRDLVASKQRALEQLAQHHVPTTLLMVLIDDLNVNQLPVLFDLFRDQEFVRSWTIQTMTYTGQGGGNFAPRRHLPVEKVERLLEEATQGVLRKADFMPLPTAHPLCYGVNYLLQDRQQALHSLARLLSREELAAHQADGYLMHPSERLEVALKEAIDRLWSEGTSSAVLSCLKELLRELYPASGALSVYQRQQLAEQWIKTIYIHAHMDEDTYEVGRAMRCPDQVPVHAEKLVGACNYNLFYRVQDKRFWCPHE